MHTILTISRQFASGGHTIGREAAKRLGIPCYDEQLIEYISEQSGFTEDYLREDSERIKGGLASLLSPSGREDAAMRRYVWNLQKPTLLELAEREDCVIVGRCADYVLRDHENVLNVFIKASMEERVKRIERLYGLDPLKAEESIRKADKQRATYYNYYATGTWGDVANYHLCMDTGVLGIDGTVELIRRAVELQQERAEEEKINW